VLRSIRARKKDDRLVAKLTRDGTGDGSLTLNESLEKDSLADWSGLRMTFWGALSGGREGRKQGGMM